MVASVLVLNDQRQGLGVVNKFQDGGHCCVLDVIVPGEAAEHHQGPQPQRQAVNFTAYRKQNMFYICTLQTYELS